MIRRMCSRSAEIFSRLLDAKEREVVLGDLAESGESPGCALREVLGLVVRRQASAWTQWQPWLTLSILIVPCGMLLSLVSRNTADLSAVYIWMYANNWDWAFLGNPGFGHELAHCVSLVFTMYLALVSWSWTSGFVLGATSCERVRVNGVLFCLMLLFGEVLGAPLYLACRWQYLHRNFGVPALSNLNEPVFALAFYRVMFPIIVQVALVVIPSVWGMRYGAGATKLRPALREMVRAVAIVTLIAIVVQNQGLWLLRRPSWGLGILHSWAVLALAVLIYWPFLYLAVAAIRQWRGEEVRAT